MSSVSDIESKKASIGSVTPYKDLARSLILSAFFVDLPLNPMVVYLLFFISTSFNVVFMVKKPTLSLHVPSINDGLFMDTGKFNK